MSTEQDLISWKTAAWTDPNMVAGYAQRMIDSSGAIMMKNRIEVAAFTRYARGQRILDVGIGTGRASLPLARGGYTVTGVDSSNAMLEKTRELAGATPISLMLGDVAKLDFPDAAFDTVMALNTIGHFPHWRPILREWQRVVKPEGRLVFDMFSLDHDIAYARAIGETDQFGEEHFAPKEAIAFYLRLKLDEILRFADEAGMRVAAIQPYSVLIGTSGFNRFFEGGPLAGKAWDRLLTWVGADNQLFDFLCFLEEEFFGNLTPQVACRFVVVLDNAADAAANRHMRERTASIDARLARAIDADLLDSAGIDKVTFRARLNGFLEHAPSRYAFYRILSASLRWPVPVVLEDFIDARWLDEARAVLSRAKLDADLSNMLTTYHQTEPFRIAGTYKGVPLAAPWEYESMIEILTETFRAFETPLFETPGGLR